MSDGDDAVDRVIGERIKARRTDMGLTQEQLARRLGVSYQQVQKYERGANRISASRLFTLARWLDVSPSHFYPEPALTALEPEPLPAGDAAPVSELAHQVGRIEDADVRTAVTGLVRAVIDRHGAFGLREQR